jgi:microcystin-dependent protein
MGDGTAGTQQSPGPNQVLGACTSAADGIYSTNPPNATMNPRAIGLGGSGAPTSFSIQQPYLVLNYIIATQGIFPSRN